MEKINTRLDKPIISSQAIVEELIKISTALVNYGKKNLLSHEYIKQIIMPKMLAAIVIKDLTIDDGTKNYKKIRYERKLISNLLKDIHQNIMPIRDDYIDNIEEIKKDIDYLLGNNKMTIDDLIEKIENIFNFKSYRLFKKYVNKNFNLLEDIDINNSVLILSQSIIKMDDGFYIRQLTLLKEMLVLEEWNSRKYIQIIIKNQNKENQIIQYSLNYNREKKKLQKSTLYKNGTEIVETKKLISEYEIIQCEEKCDISIITQFDDIIIKN